MRELDVMGCAALRAFQLARVLPIQRIVFPSSTAVLDLLRALSSDGFASLHRSPPLLYHNDMTASVPRFYWSEEFGYALWLRLYFANLRRDHAAGEAR